MIKLSRLADYAVVLLTQMGSDPKGVHNALDLAHCTGLPVPTVSKVLATLARDGVLASVRGAKGGYRLAAAPERISVAEIIAAIDGPIALTQCVDRSADICTVETLCPSRAGWHKINQAVERALSEVSLAELMGTPPLLAELPTAARASRRSAPGHGS
ncbi:MAG: SUF system Fe-S cluster assembly regulator [Alphaproteobacteria bacterium]|nr:SUF system Fe-S cluster assembly regulator [Alphaproteobacteria bacterium]